MKKFLFSLFVLLFIAHPVLAQKFDTDAEDLIEKDGLICTKDGTPLTGTVRADLFAYHIFVDYKNGVPDKIGKVYGVNGNFLGELSVEDDSQENPLVSKISDSFRTDNSMHYYTKRYMYNCASAYLQRGIKGSVDCESLVEKPSFQLIGDLSKYRVSEDVKDGKKTLKVEGVFVPVKFRLSLGRADDEIGMTAQIQRSGNAVFFFDPYKAGKQ